jgi:hypothetical protein
MQSHKAPCRPWPVTFTASSARLCCCRSCTLSWKQSSQSETVHACPVGAHTWVTTVAHSWVFVARSDVSAHAAAQLNLAGWLGCCLPPGPNPNPNPGSRFLSEPMPGAPADPATGGDPVEAGILAAAAQRQAARAQRRRDEAAARLRRRQRSKKEAAGSPGSGGWVGWMGTRCRCGLCVSRWLMPVSPARLRRMPPGTPSLVCRCEGTCDMTLAGYVGADAAFSDGCLVAGEVMQPCSIFMKFTCGGRVKTTQVMQRTMSSTCFRRSPTIRTFWRK